MTLTSSPTGPTWAVMSRVFLSLMDPVVPFLSEGDDQAPAWDAAPPGDATPPRAEEQS